MKRITVSITIGVLVVITLFIAIELFDLILIRRGTELPFLERNPSGWLLEWPLIFLKDIFPPEEGAMIRLSIPGIIAAILCNIFLYSLLSYIILWWYARHKRLT